MLRIIGIAYGPNKGYNKLTPRDPKAKISRRKGHLSKRTQFVREIVKEVAGWVHFTSTLRRISPLTVVEQ